MGSEMCIRDSQTAVGRQNLVCTDHGKAIAQSDDDLGIDPGQFLRQTDVIRCVTESAAGAVVEPVHSEEVARVRCICIHCADFGGDPAYCFGCVGQFPEQRQADADTAQVFDGAGIGLLILYLVREVERIHSVVQVEEKRRQYTDTGAGTPDAVLMGPGLAQNTSAKRESAINTADDLSGRIAYCQPVHAGNGNKGE